MRANRGRGIRVVENSSLYLGLAAFPSGELVALVAMPESLKELLLGFLFFALEKDDILEKS